MLYAIEKRNKRVRELTIQRDMLISTVDVESKFGIPALWNEKQKLEAEKRSIDVKLAVLTALEDAKNVVSLEKGIDNDVWFDSRNVQRLFGREFVGYVTDRCPAAKIEAACAELIEALQHYVPDGLRATDAELIGNVEEDDNGTWRLTFEFE